MTWQPFQRHASMCTSPASSVEFILVMPVLLTFLFAIGSFAMLSHQNTVIQHSLATLATRSPPDGSSKTETSSSATSSAAAPTSTRAAHGDQRERQDRNQRGRQRRRLHRERPWGLDAQDRDAPRRRRADIAYEYNDPLSLGRKTVLTRHVSHSYTTYTDWEVL